MCGIAGICHLYGNQPISRDTITQMTRLVRHRGPDEMRIYLYAKNHGIEPQQAAQSVQLTPKQVADIYKDIDAKRNATTYLHTAPILVQSIPEINVAQHCDITTKNR